MNQLEVPNLVCLGCTQRESESHKRIKMEKSDLFNKLVSSSTSTMKKFNNVTERDDGRKKRSVLKHAEKRSRSKEDRIEKEKTKTES